MMTFHFEEHIGALIEGQKVILLTENDEYLCSRLDKSGYENVFLHEDPEGFLVFVGEKINYRSIPPYQAKEVTKQVAKATVRELGRSSVTIKIKRHPLFFWKKVIRFYLNSGWYRLDSTGPYTILMDSYQLIQKTVDK